MKDKETLGLDSLAIHAGQRPEEWQGATLPPIYQSASHLFKSAESLSRAFAGQTDDHIYMRMTNPTNRILEEKLAALEGGKGAIIMASGMAAVTNACMALLRAGDEFVAANSLFLSTYLFFTETLKRFDIMPRLVEAADTQAMQNAINEKTRFIYVETIGNPKMDVPDLAAIAEVGRQHALPVLVDNTLASPYLCRPLELGANIVIHSTTKYLSGHGAVVGGVVIDGGNFNWGTKRFSDFEPFIDRKGNLAYLDKVWHQQHMIFGTTQAPFHSFLTHIGLDTLALRMDRTLSNALGVARFLRERDEVQWVNYPGLEDHPSHAVAAKQFGGRGFGGMLTFGLRDMDDCFEFIDNLQLIYNLANLGDCKTLVIHPYSTQFVSFDEDTRRMLGVSTDMIRLSLGIEALEDITADLSQALGQLTR